MSYEPLHHKYRPQKFADLVGQVAIATTLTNAIVQKRIAPAYLLTGPRGTGKTSSARIIAKSLNCLSSDDPTPDPCGQCEVCISIARGTALDVIEIDAASHTGVDNIREIIERCQFSPVQCRYKVYVIDECHMLSSAAFNALLKTLEEPPERVIFILATTDPQRVLPTIISRCQRFDYRRIPLQDMVSHLEKIAKIEQIEIQAEAVTLVAQLSNGGLRDAESLLDQLSLLSGEISTERISDLVGAVSEQDLLILLQAIKNQKPEEVIQKCRQLLDRGREPLIILQNLTNFYLSLLIAKTAPDRQDLVALTPSLWTVLKEEVKRWSKDEILRGQQLLKESEVQIKNTTQPRLWLEVTLMGLLTPVQTQPIQSSSQITPSTPIQSSLNEIWQQVLSNLSPPTTQSLVTQQCYLMSLDERTAEVGVNSEPIYKYYQNQLKTLDAAFAKVCQRNIKVNFQIGNSKVSSKSSSNSPKDKQNIAPQIVSEPPKDKQNISVKEVDSEYFSSGGSPNVRKAAQTLAKVFDGEIVEDSLPDEKPRVKDTVNEEDSTDEPPF